MAVKTMTLAAMNAFVDRLAKSNTGYDQGARWTFYNPATRTINPNREADCSSLCGAIMHAAGFPVDLSGTFYTGNMAVKAKAAGFQVIRFTSLAQVRPGDFLLNTIWHVEYAYTATRWYSARIDEKGGITGGLAGNQTGRETGFVNAYIYSKGWDYILRPPASGGTPKPAPPAKPQPPREWPAVALLVDGVWGPVTRRAYQQLLAGIDRYKGIIDGVFGRLSIIAEQQWLAGLGYYKGRVDGIRGPLTIKALQAFLRSKRHYSGLIDGSHGVLTTKGLQAYFNAQAKYFKK